MLRLSVTCGALPILGGGDVWLCRGKARVELGGEWVLLRLCGQEAELAMLTPTYVSRIRGGCRKPDLAHRAVAGSVSRWEGRGGHELVESSVSE